MMLRSNLKLCLAACLLVAIAVPAVAQEWAGRGRASGTVRDEDGNAVVGARVQVYLRNPDNGPEGLLTDEKGRFNFGGLAGGAWTVLIDAEGYKPSQGQMNVTQFGSTKSAAIIMVRDPQFAITTGDRLLDAGDYAGARRDYNEAMKGLDAIGQARLRSRVGDTYVEEGDLEAAQREYQQALEYLDPTEQAAVRIKLGNAHQRQGNYAAARAEFERASTSLEGEGKVVVLTEIAKGYYAEGNVDQAIATLKQAVEMAPENIEAIQVLADLLTRQGKEAEAAEVLAKLPEGAKLPTDMVLNIGIRLYNEGDTEKALEYFERAVAESPDNGEGYYYRGLCLLGTGNNDGARADFEKLLEIDPDNGHRTEVEEFLEFLNQ